VKNIYEYFTFFVKRIMFILNLMDSKQAERERKGGGVKIKKIEFHISIA
jgi:hypothetical protein